MWQWLPSIKSFKRFLFLNGCYGKDITWLRNYSRMLASSKFSGQDFSSPARFFSTLSASTWPQPNPIYPGTAMTSLDRREESSELTTLSSCCSINCSSLSWTWFESIMWSMWTESPQYWASVQHPTDLRIKEESPIIGIQNIFTAI